MGLLINARPRSMPGRRRAGEGHDMGSTSKFVWTTTKAMRKHIVERLKNNNMFDLTECRLALKHLCSLIVREANTDFEQLLYLDTHYKTEQRSKMLNKYDTNGDGILDQEELDSAGFAVPKLTAWDIPKISMLSEDIAPIVEQLKQADENDPP